MENCILILLVIALAIIWDIKGYWAHTIRVAHVVAVVEVARRIHKEHVSTALQENGFVAIENSSLFSHINRLPRTKGKKLEIKTESHLERK